MKLFAIIAALIASAGPHPAPLVTAQAATAMDSTVAARPFGVGEKLTYDIKFGKLHVGTGYMQVLDTERVRDHEAYHTLFSIQGGIPLFRVDDRYESWFDTSTLSSVRYTQNIDEGQYQRKSHYEIFPRRSLYREGNADDPKPSVRNPLDDGSFLYFIRTVPLVVGETYTFSRYFRPDRNPVTIRVLRRERVTVPAGTFDAVVIQPIIKTTGIFSDKGQAEIWLSDDSRRIMLQMKSKLSIGSINLYLQSYQPPATSAAGS
ncbi:MAG TPA: DUF3108 domain-containing protein [Gemmatimonadaceae bacterium]|nr:DUF3108 domain-containing protein [Gemmatimonadaceae bacterium]